MASFQAKIGRKGRRKRQNRKTNMASFPAKIGWTKLRKRENKNYRSALLLHEA